VKLDKKLPNKDTIGAAYERANPTCGKKVTCSVLI